MASIRKKPNGKYEVQVRRKGCAPVCRNFHSRNDALEWARHMEVKADRGDLPTPIRELCRHTVRSILERYRDEISAKKKSHNSERYVINALMRQPFANIDLGTITATKFSEYKDIRLKSVQPGTVRRELALLKHAFDVAERVWCIPIRENPLNKLSKIRPQAGRSRRLEEGEFDKIIAAAESTRNILILPMIRFAVATGMRRGEILRMRWDDLDLTVKTLRIPITKNGHARTIPLSGEAIAVLKDLKPRSDAQSVFGMTDNSVKLAWQRLCKRSGVKDFHFHDFRHEAISRFFERGLTVPEVALISGHRDYRMLFRYTHLKAEDVATKLL